MVELYVRLVVPPALRSPDDVAAEAMRVGRLVRWNENERQQRFEELKLAQLLRLVERPLRFSCEPKSISAALEAETALGIMPDDIVQHGRRTNDPMTPGR